MRISLRELLRMKGIDSKSPKPTWDLIGTEEDLADLDLGQELGEIQPGDTKEEDTFDTR